MPPDALARVRETLGEEGFGVLGPGVSAGAGGTSAQSYDSSTLGLAHGPGALRGRAAPLPYRPLTSCPALHFQHRFAGSPGRCSGVAHDLVPREL